MTEIGYALSSEEHTPSALVRNAKLAEDAGFAFALISDHFHPWTDSQGHSPFVWAVIGGIAQATSRLRLGTGVTCPTVRTHPAIVAHAAATCAAMMPGRFFLGVGSGEKLNEHIFGDPWPGAHTRLEMLDEAIDVIRMLWQGGWQNFEGAYYTLDHARLYTLPEHPPELLMAAGGKQSAALAGKRADGLIATSAKSEIVQAFDAAGGQGKQKFGQYAACYDEDEAEARRTAYRIWPTAAVRGELSQELPLPRHFEQAAKMVTEDDVAKVVVCGKDPEAHLEKIREFEKAGFTHVYVHQVGPNQEGFIRFYQREVMPRAAQ